MRLGRSLLLEAPVRREDGAGGYRDEWQPLGSLWAAVKVGSGREASGTEVTGPQVSYRITVRGAAEGSPSRPRAGQRFREGGRVFRILAVAEADDTGRHLTCFAQEGVA